MGNENTPSRLQLELQRRIAQQRIEEIKAVLASGVQAGTHGALSEDIAAVIVRLSNPCLSEADLSSCIGILELLLLPEGLVPLMELMINESYEIHLRRQAAQAISVIGSDYIREELNDLVADNSVEICELAKMALGHPSAPPNPNR